MRCGASLVGLCALLSALLALGQSVSAKAVATGYRMEEGAWGGGSYNEESGAFAFCFMGTITGSGDRIGVLLLADATIWVTVANDSWALPRDQRYAAVIEADDTRREVKGEAKMGGLVFDLHRDPGFFEAMRNGGEFRFAGASKTVSIDLRPDTFDALTALEDCLAKHAGLDLQGKAVSGGGQKGSPNPASGGGGTAQNPFAPTAPSPLPSTGSPGKDAAVLGELRTLMQEAGYPDPQMVDLRESDKDFLFAWTSTSTTLVGFLSAGLPKTGNYRDELEAQMSSLRADCGFGGQIIYDPQTTTYEGKPIYSGRVDCGDDAFAIYFVMVVMDKSVLKFYHVADRGSMAVGQQINANLRNRLRSY